jgi:hypothetical protein
MKVASGGAGSLPVSSLVPRDTPQIGKTLKVGITNLPTGSAALFMGWNKNTPGLSLANVGMPGCEAHASLDAVALLTGTGTDAMRSLAIPCQPLLLGVRFCMQAAVLDPGAGNALGAVASDASEGVAGGA